MKEWEGRDRGSQRNVEFGEVAEPVPNPEPLIGNSLGGMHERPGFEIGALDVPSDSYATFVWCDKSKLEPSIGRVLLPVDDLAIGEIAKGSGVASNLQKLASFGNELNEARESLGEVAKSVSEGRATYQLGALVSGEDAERIQNQLSTLVGQVETLQRRELKQHPADPLLSTLAQQIAGVKVEVEALKADQEPKTWSTFDSIGRAVLSVVVGALASAVFGGVALHFFMHKALMEAFVESLIGGAAGAGAAEIVEHVDGARRHRHP